MGFPTWDRFIAVRVHWCQSFEHSLLLLSISVSSTDTTVSEKDWVLLLTVPIPCRVKAEIHDFKYISRKFKLF